ncbi:replication-associated recombination protein A [Clostridium sp. 'White wine YQ']|uniref:replication-associated recombination protein A n=1 Tax=Clostridium sp. 'White wine YQ' TaxID=3027474 RepID=UPI002365A24A|nr:replication-associated recombination protein A [Clostridium sp. 'White wine YQ']MDD7793300.1 replication-associated recombination protein A [Clostridium sp. 'White wine YQ']
MYKPLADKVRPRKIDEVFGQKHILGEGKILSRIIKSNRISNMIFYGPPGVGKTTVANIIAETSNKRFYKLNATNASLKDIQEIVADLDTLMGTSGVVLYLDEIQNFNKKQQQSLLEFIEDGRITLIASTTENPFHYIFKAILSRSTIFEFKPLEKDDIIEALKRARVLAEEDYHGVKIEITDEAYEFLGDSSNGDVRKAINGLEVALYSTNPDREGRILIDREVAADSVQKKILNYDINGDSHYDILSAFQKSIRGSDPDAAIHYLARLVKAGDLISICRRLMVIAAEDIGLAYPQGISIVKACVDSAQMLGFPEARIPLAEATILLATAPKSNSAVMAIGRALEDLDNVEVGDVPIHLKDAHYAGAASLGRGIEYKYPHSYPNHYIEQQYLPDSLKDAKYYEAGENKFEGSIKRYWDGIKKE